MWQSWYSLETLKLVFSEYQACHTDGLSVSVVWKFIYRSPTDYFPAWVPSTNGICKQFLHLQIYTLDVDIYIYCGYKSPYWIFTMEYTDGRISIAHDAVMFSEMTCSISVSDECYNTNPLLLADGLYRMRNKYHFILNIFPKYLHVHIYECVKYMNERMTTVMSSFVHSYILHIYFTLPYSVWSRLSQLSIQHFRLYNGWPCNCGC